MNESMSWIEMLSNWSEHALMLALYAAASSALLAVVVLVINMLFRRWLSSRQMGLLWGIVLLRLFVPIAPSSPLSLQNLCAAVFSSEQTEIMGEHVSDVGRKSDLYPAPPAAVASMPAPTPFVPHASSHTI